MTDAAPSGGKSEPSSSPPQPRLGDQVLLLNGESAEVVGGCAFGCLIMKYKNGLCEHVERESVAAITWSAGPD